MDEASDQMSDSGGVVIDENQNEQATESATTQLSGDKVNSKNDDKTRNEKGHGKTKNKNKNKTESDNGNQRKSSRKSRSKSLDSAPAAQQISSAEDESHDAIAASAPEIGADDPTKNDAAEKPNQQKVMDKRKYPYSSVYFRGDVWAAYIYPYSTFC